MGKDKKNDQSASDDHPPQEVPSAPPPPPPSTLDELFQAVINGKDDVVELLLTRDNVNYPDPDRQLTLLMWAVEANEQKIAQSLLAKGALQHLTDPSGYTALHRAAFKKNDNMVRLLLKFDSSVDNINRAGGVSRRTPLILAAMQGSHGVVEVILKQILSNRASSDLLGSIVDTRDTAGMSAGDHAAFRGFESIVKLLCETGGASANATLFFADDGEKHALTTEQKERYEGLLKYLYTPWCEQSVVTP